MDEKDEEGSLQRGRCSFFPSNNVHARACVRACIYFSDFDPRVYLSSPGEGFGTLAVSAAVASGDEVGDAA